MMSGQGHGQDEVRVRMGVRTGTWSGSGWGQGYSQGRDRRGRVSRLGQDGVRDMVRVWIGSHSG